jgi:ssDNA-binding Zn-finger/Zn-ribbon topoisomerase 1
MKNVQMYAQKVGESCSSCHKNYMLPVKAKYHFPYYDLISIEDPVSGGSYSVEDYMKKISTDYKLVNVYSSDGKYQDALKAADSFSKRYKGLTQMCSECHTNKIVEDVYFGKETNDALNALKNAIANKDHAKIGQSMGVIGGTCYKCHNVHEVPIMLKDKLTK